MFARIKIYSLFFIALSLAACGSRKEHIEPIYQTEHLQLQDVEVELWNNIDMIEVEPSFVRQITRIFFGWIPGVGGLLELPMDLVSVLMPPLPSISHPAIPKEGAWNDPKVLDALKSIRLGAGYIRITPKEERGPNYRSEKCFWPWEWGDEVFVCADPGFDSFLSGVSVFLMFKDVRANNVVSAIPQEKEILLAYAETERDYDKPHKTLYFNVPDDLNLRTYMDLYERFEVKIIARGKWPRQKVYLDGKLRLNLVVKLATS